jgi:hypothetical protein
MNFRERIEAVLHRQRPDKVPFAPYDEMVPRGDFVRELRNRGMGLWTFHTRDYWSECPNVTRETRVEGDRTTSIVHTPAGSVTSSTRTHLSRSVTRSRAIGAEGMIKGVEDYDPVIFLIDDEVFHPDYEVYHWLSRDLGDDGHVRVQGFADPYSTAYGYFGRGTPDGMTNYVYHQLDHPHHFNRLLEALERSNERLFPVVAESPAEVVCLGSVNGAYGPAQYEEHILPFYEKYVPLFHEKGKILYNHAHSSYLRSYIDLLPRTGLDMIDAFTPPPIGNLSVEEARAAWGDGVIISVNFPETFFWHGPEATKQYTLDLLQQDPTGPLIITFTEMAICMVADDETEEAYKSGMVAIMDAIDEFCG